MRRASHFGRRAQRRWIDWLKLYVVLEVAISKAPTTANLQVIMRFFSKILAEIASKYATESLSPLQ
jgi:hypothetical protein